MRSALIMISALLLAAGASAATYLVLPDGTGDFATIPEAVDAAASGDSVVLGDGEYFLGRSIDYGGKDIALCSASGDPASCTIVPHSGDVGVEITNGSTEAAVLGGVTIRGVSTDGTGAVVIGAASPAIRDCVFRDNRALYGAGICVSHGSPRIVDCTFLGNRAGGVGEAVYASEGSTTLTNCRITGVASTASTAAGAPSTSPTASLRATSDAEWIAARARARSPVRPLRATTTIMRAAACAPRAVPSSMPSAA